MTTKVYVSMTDKFMSNWGLSKNRINKLVIECDTYSEAVTVYNNALNRSDMIRVNICSKKPYYPKYSHFTQYKAKPEMKYWFIKGHFKGNASK